MSQYTVQVTAGGRPQVGVTGRASPQVAAQSSGMTGPPGPAGPAGPAGPPGPGALAGIQGTVSQLPPAGQFYGEAWIVSPNGELWIWKETT